MERRHDRAVQADRRRARWLALATSLVLGVCLSAVAVLAWRVVDASRDLRLYMADDSSWVIAQLEVDHQHVLLALQGQLNQTPAQDGSLSEVLLKFDIYFSRVQTVLSHTATVKDFVAEREEFDARLEIIRNNLSSVTPLVDALRPGDLAGLAQMNALMAEVMPDIRYVVVTAVQTWQRRAQMLRLQREAVLEQFLTAGALALALILGLLAVSAHLYRQSALRTAMVERLDSNLRASFEAALDGVIVTDAEGRILLFNSAAEALFNQRRAFVIGRSISILLPPRAGQRQAIDARQLIQQIERRRRRRLRLHGRDGQMLPISVSAVGDTGSSGQPIHIGFVRDISSVVMMERQRRQAARRIERDAAEKVRFLAATSHELRTPMQGVLGAIDLVLRQQSDPAIQSLLHIAQESAVAALDQIDHVLEITALDDVTQPERADEPFSAATIAADLIAAAVRNGPQEGLDIRLDLVGDVPSEVIGKPRAFRQTLRNLISNAVKFGGGKPIILRLSSLSPNALRVEVEDAGIGIDPKDQSRIFDDFEALDRDYTRLSGGIGIGLGIVRRAVLSMRGTVGVISRLGQGSIFWFEIPVRPALPRAQAVGQPAPMQVLVVDDQSINRLLMQKMIDALGHRADQANSGQVAIRMARAERYDLILMDISMPEMDGIEATRHIRAEGASRQSPIVGFTANLQPADHARALAAGMREILYKPARPTDVERVLYNVPSAPPAEDVAGLNEGICDAVDLLANSLGVNRLAKLVDDVDSSFHALFDYASAEADLAELASQAHKCAGAAAILGALPLHAACCALETASLKHETAQIGDHVQNCQSALSVCGGLIRARVDELARQQAKANR
jgi:PAS domain S-box-containing protein